MYAPLTSLTREEEVPRRFVPADYDADKLRVLQQVFDETWEEVAHLYPSESAEEARTILAKAVVAAASGGISDMSQLRDRALQTLQVEFVPPKM
jgi:hypothetical protein